MSGPQPQASYSHQSLGRSAPPALLPPCRLVAWALAQNTTLRSLSLLGCDLGADGGREVAAALRANTSLRVLSLGNTGIGWRPVVGDENFIDISSPPEVREGPHNIEPPPQCQALQ